MSGRRAGWVRLSFFVVRPPGRIDSGVQVPCEPDRRNRRVDGNSAPNLGGPDVAGGSGRRREHAWTVLWAESGGKPASCTIWPSRVFRLNSATFRFSVMTENTAAGNPAGDGNVHSPQRHPGVQKRGIASGIAFPRRCGGPGKIRGISSDIDETGNRLKITLYILLFKDDLVRFP